MTLRREGSLLRLVVADDGRGFEGGGAAISPGPSGRFGLFNIRERITPLGGSLYIESGPGKGSRVTISLPLDSSGAEPGEGAEDDHQGAAG